MVADLLHRALADVDEPLVISNQPSYLTLIPAAQYNAGVVADLLHRALADVDEPLAISALAPAPDPPPHDLCSTEALGEARVLRPAEHSSLSLGPLRTGNSGRMWLGVISQT